MSGAADTFPSGSSPLRFGRLGLIMARSLSDLQVMEIPELMLGGLTWTEIAGRVGGQADALRMRLSRAVATVLSELGHKKLSHAH